jgi:membrane protease YdiL (CAAX protease family)
MSFVETSFVRKRPATSFFALTYILSYVVGILVAVLLQILLPSSLRDSADVFAKYGPTLAGVFMAWAVAGRAGLMRLVSGLLTFRIHLGWYAFALLLPFVMVVVSIAVFAMTGGNLQTENWRSATLLSLIVLIPTKIFFGGGLGEELGWRGFALPQLQKRMTALKASLIIWIVWSVWHFPAIALDANREGEMPIVMFTIFVLAITILLTWAFNSTSGNLLILVLFHAAANASEHLLELLVPLPDRVIALAWLTAFYCVIATLIVVVHRGDRLSGRKRVVWDVKDPDIGQSGMIKIRKQTMGSTRMLCAPGV